MTTRDLINAIAAGDAIEIENSFNLAMAEKVSERLEDMRMEVAQNLFSGHAQSEEPEAQVEQLTGETTTAEE